MSIIWSCAVGLSPIYRIKTIFFHNNLLLIFNSVEILFDRRPKVSNEAGIFLWVTLHRLPCPLSRVKLPILSGANVFRPFASSKVDATAVTQDQPRQWRYRIQPGQAQFSQFCASSVIKPPFACSGACTLLDLVKTELSSSHIIIYACIGWAMP